MPVVFYLCLHNEIHLPLFVYLQLVARPFSLFGFRVSLRGQISDTTQEHAGLLQCTSILLFSSLYLRIQQNFILDSYQRKRSLSGGKHKLFPYLRTHVLRTHVLFACSVTYFLTMCVFTKGNFTLPFRSVIKRCLVRFIFLILIVTEMNIIKQYVLIVE